jgi:hypothetical protein
LEFFAEEILCDVSTIVSPESMASPLPVKAWGKEGENLRVWRLSQIVITSAHSCLVSRDMKVG